ncbi:MAG: hypothetical protein WC796_05310 [Candidatus Pacearchaeota archaeon]|jgi:hypothetical protein
MKRFLSGLTGIALLIVPLFILQNYGRYVNRVEEPHLEQPAVREYKEDLVLSRQLECMGDYPITNETRQKVKNRLERLEQTTEVKSYCLTEDEIRNQGKHVALEVIPTMALGVGLIIYSAKGSKNKEE